MVSQERTYTVAEYEAYIAQHPDRRFELINGEIVEKMPTQLHGVIVALFVFFIQKYLFENPIAWVMAEARHGLPEDDQNSRVPDIAVVLREGRTLTEEGAAPYMPDLAIEVQSPGQSDRLMTDKADYYLKNGARMVWLVYPKKRIVEVLTSTERHLLTIEDTISGGEVLPGFGLPVREVFPA